VSLVINRAAVILKYKTPAIEWINKADPFHDDPGITANDVNQERTVYLIRHEDAETPQILARWIELNHKSLFESELEGWYTDPKLWPKRRSLKEFCKWFDVECHTVLIDTLKGGIYDEDI
jgi:hypothetical protein